MVLALLFETLPFVVRSVQPVLRELDREAEQAATSLGATPFVTFRRVILPALVPAIASGCSLAFAKAVGEFGSVVLISGNIPLKTQVASVAIFGHLESPATPRARPRWPCCLLALSLGMLLLIGIIERLARRHEEAYDRAQLVRYGVRFVALGYLGALLIAPLVLIFKDTFAHGIGRRLGRPDSQVDALHAAKLTLYAMLIAVVANTLFGVAIALYLARRKGFLATVLGAFIDLPLGALSGGRRPRAAARVRPDRLVRAVAQRATASRSCSRSRRSSIATAFVSLPFVARELIPVLREIGEEQQQAAATLGATRTADVLPHHAARHPAGADLRHRAHGRACARRVRRRRRRLWRHPGPDRDAHADRGSATGTTSTRPAPTRPSLLLAAFAVVVLIVLNLGEAGA